jgi:hypothetical protein
MIFIYLIYCLRKKFVHKIKEDLKWKIEDFQKDGFEYQNLLYMDYDSKVFSINEDYDNEDNMKFNQIFCVEIKNNHENKEEEFKSLIKYNKIDLADDPKFDDFYINEDKIWEFIIYSIILDKSEFVNIILQNSGKKLGKFPILDLIRLYEQVRESNLANKSKLINLKTFRIEYLKENLFLKVI